MAVAWDTTLVSRLRPGSPALTLLRSRLRSPNEVAIPAVSIAEAAFGYARAGRSDDLTWLTRLVASPEIGVIGFPLAAALAAGRLRATAPHPPLPSRSRRTKPERHVAWVADIHIAASAWAVGIPLETENVRDFAILSELLRELVPAGRPLEVRPSPLTG